MLVNLPYNRAGALQYAQEWALKRNSAYLDFENIGGDCTNFASQCIYAGSKVMNYTPVTGWFYISSYSRSASWTGVEYLYKFLTSNKDAGPYAVETDLSGLDIGDIVQLGDRNYHYYHSPVVVGITPQSVLLAAHTFDVYGKPLENYIYYTARFLHIKGVRKYR